jgi:hypothetical protein
VSKLILHIGHPKTGTTALQSVLFSNADLLVRSGVIYPNLSDYGYQKHILAIPYLAGVTNLGLHLRTGARGAELTDISRKYWMRLQDHVALRSPKTIVLSCEGLFTIPTCTGFRTKLADLSSQVTVVAYLRSPAKRFLSQINQNIRMFRRFTLPPAEYYRPVLEAYHAGGFKELSLNIFDSRYLYHKDIVADFVHKYLPSDLPLLNRNAIENNESVSNEALALLAEIPDRWDVSDPQAVGSRRRKAVSIIRTADRIVEGNLRPSLEPEIEAALIARSTDLLWLRDVHGLEFTDVEYSSIGRLGSLDLSTLNHLEDFCHIDIDRLATLRAKTKAALENVFDGKIRRWFTAMRVTR